MKKLLLLPIFTFYIFFQLPAQIVHRTVSAVVHGYIRLPVRDSFDIEGDGIYDIRMISRQTIDTYSITDSVLSNDIGVTGGRFEYGMPIVYYGSYREATGFITGTYTMGCGGWGWSDGIPKYKGFFRVQPTGDTTYGWIKYNSIGDSTTCTDTVYAMEVAYCLIPNVKLLAGQTRIYSLGNYSKLRAWPNVTRGPIKIQSHYEDSKEVFLLDTERKKILSFRIASGQILSFDLGFLPPGMYFVQSEDMDWGLKVIKQ